MRAAIIAIMFLFGVAVGFGIAYSLRKTGENVQSGREELDAEKKLQESRKQKDLKTISELKESLGEKDGRVAELEERLAKITESAKPVQSEPGGKGASAQTPAVVSGGASQAPAGQPAAEDEKKAKEKAKEKELLDRLGDLLSRIEAAPADRKLVSEFAEAVWELQDVVALDEMVTKLKKIFEDVLADNPENVDLLYNQGNAYAAEMAYMMLKLEENPMVYGPKMGEVALKALFCFNKVLAKNPGDNEALLTRGFWHYHSPGYTEYAQKDFAELARRAKTQSFDQELGEQIYLGMAMTYAKMDKTEEARKSAEEGLGLYPQSEALRKMLEKLRK